MGWWNWPHGQLLNAAIGAAVVVTGFVMSRVSEKNRAVARWWWPFITVLVTAGAAANAVLNQWAWALFETLVAAWGAWLAYKAWHVPAKDGA